MTLNIQKPHKITRLAMSHAIGFVALMSSSVCRRPPAFIVSINTAAYQQRGDGGSCLETKLALTYIMSLFTSTRYISSI